MWPGPLKDTGGEVGGLAEKLIQLGRTSQQRHVGFQRSTPSSEKAPFSRSPSLHVLSRGGIRFSEGLLKVIPCRFPSRVFFDERGRRERERERERQPRFAPRTHGAVRGVPHRMDERCRDRATRSTPTRADSTQKASRETAITISLQRTALAARARTHSRDTHTHRRTRGSAHTYTHSGDRHTHTHTNTGKHTHRQAPLKVQNRNRRGF